MDPKAERLKNAGRRIEIEWDDGRYYRGTVVQVRCCGDGRVCRLKGWTERVAGTSSVFSTA